MGDESHIAFHTRALKNSQSIVKDLTSSDGFLADFVRRTMPESLRRYVGVSDLLQSVWLRVQNNQDKANELNDLQYRSWILRIARRKLVDCLRHYRLTEKTRFHIPKRLPESSNFDAISPETSPVHLVSLHEEADRLLAALAALPSDIQQIVTLRYSENLTFPQIAQKLQVSTTTCRRRWLEGCEMLRNELGDSI